MTIARQDPRAQAAAPLRTEALEVIYPNGTRALQRTTLQFARGSFNILLGPSGAGKSSLLRSLNGLVKPTRGCVLADGIGDLAQRDALRRHRRQTGMIFQHHHLIGRLSVLSNVLMGRLGYHGPLVALRAWSRQEKLLALAAIERVGLLDYALQRADQLSGGQQQRVGIARALVQQPRLLLADEPVASLDPATAAHVLTLLHDICKRDGLTAVVSLHQVDLARRFGERILGLRNGAVVFDGTADQLCAEQADALYRKPDATATAPFSHSAAPAYLEHTGVLS